MEIEMNNEHVHEASAAEAPVQDTQVSQETTSDGAQNDAPPVDDSPLTRENIAERAKKAKGEEASEEKPLPGQAERGPDGKFLPKAGKDAKPAGKTPETTQAQGDPAASAQDYKLNPKFTVLGKEYEIPKWAHAAIKDPETEKQFKEVYEKALGLDHVKMRHQQLNDQHVELKSSHEELVGGVTELREIYQDAVGTGNLLRLDDFFSRLKIPPQVVLQYALQRAQYEELPPAERQAVDLALSNQRRAFDLDKQNRGLSTEAVSHQTAALGVMLNSSLARPDVSTIAQAFDSAPGRKPGDFRKAVVERGEYAWYKSQGKVLLDPEQAVQEVIAMYGLSAPAPQAQVPAAQPAGQQVQAAPQAQQTPAPAAHREVPVIPSVAGKTGASPTHIKKPRSIDDLRKIQRSAVSG